MTIREGYEEVGDGLNNNQFNLDRIALDEYGEHQLSHP